MNKQEIESCHFCRGKIEPLKMIFPKVLWEIGCHNKYCAFKPLSCGFKTKQEAIKAWNKRIF